MVIASVATPPFPSVTVIATGTGPSCAGAVHIDRFADGVASVPDGADHAYARVSASGSAASAATVMLWPAAMVHGSQRSRTDGGWFCDGVDGVVTAGRG